MPGTFYTCRYSYSFDPDILTYLMVQDRFSYTEEILTRDGFHQKHEVYPLTTVLHSRSLLNELAQYILML